MCDVVFRVLAIASAALLALAESFATTATRQPLPRQDAANVAEFVLRRL